MSSGMTFPDDAAREPSHRVMEQAAEWYALLRSGEASDHDRTLWRTWLDDDPQHRRAWSYVEAISHRFGPLQSTPDPKRTADNLWAANARTLQRRRLLTCFALLAGTGLLGWTVWRHTPLPCMALARFADHRSELGEIREVALTDGTRVWLNTTTSLNEHYSADLRRLRLIEGEILIETAADAARPFVVDTPQGRLQALGTRFTVRREESATFLAVYEGAVSIRTEAGVTAVIDAGRQTRFTADATAATEPADTARQAWSRGLLIVQDTPLSAVVQELRRYRPGYLGVAPEVADLQVFGSFP